MGGVLSILMLHLYKFKFNNTGAQIYCTMKLRFWLAKPGLKLRVHNGNLIFSTITYVVGTQKNRLNA